MSDISTDTANTDTPKAEALLATLARDTLLDLYRQMVLIRQTEEQLARAHQAGQVHGACHTYVGEEAIAVGVCAHLGQKDTVFSTHRGHGHALAKGVSPRELIAELLGRETGVSHGRGGSMHLFKPEIGLMGTSGIVGPCILQAAGAGYTYMLLKQPYVGVAFFGDGAVNNGAFHEGINMATVWDLPALFVCENNEFATEVPFNAATRNTDVASKAKSFGLPGVPVDGNDVLAVYAAAGAAIERARAGKGPTLIEGRTYRTRPHAEGMRDGGYRTAEEIEAWKARDPILVYRTRLLDANIAPEDALTAIDDEIKATVTEAYEFARNSPWPDPATALDHVYSH